MRFVKIKSRGLESIYHVPKKWNNKRVKSELGDMFPIEKITSIPESKVPKKELTEVYKNTKERTRRK